MDRQFEISSDLEFYCYLKVHLPDGSTIVSEPKVSYYSEWYFAYRVFHHGKLWKEYAGDFKGIEPGSLVKEARQILESLRV